MAGTQPASQTAPPAQSAPPARRRRRGGVLALLVTLVVLALIVVLVIALNGGTNVSYRASIASVQPLSSTEVSVSTPACTINLKSPNGAYTGEGVITASQSLAQGAQTTLRDTITVTHDGAHFVTAAASSLNCV